ncbi:MAG: nucleotidyl transferase AbiEii/AbiGii toxin family protein [Pirellulales bacterium]
MDEPLQITLTDAVRFLDAQGVPYALIGGLAASLRGRPRATVDVDLVVVMEIDGIAEFLRQLQQTALRPVFDDAETVARQAFLLPLRHARTKVKVDLAIGLSGFEQQAVGRAETLQLGNEPVRVATAEDLILMKVLAGRPQDEQDLVGLVLAQGDRIDWNYCLNVGADLGEAIGQDLTGRIRQLRDEHKSSE